MEIGRGFKLFNINVNRRKKRTWNIFCVYGGLARGKKEVNNGKKARCYTRTKKKQTHKVLS